jgi:hypothetical protein
MLPQCNTDSNNCMLRSASQRIKIYTEWKLQQSLKENYSHQSQLVVWEDLQNGGLPRKTQYDHTQQSKESLFILSKGNFLSPE